MLIFAVCGDADLGRAHLHGFSPSRLYRWFYEHDDPWSMVPGGPDTRLGRREAAAFAGGPVYSVQRCPGRVLLQVLTDFVPNLACPLIGFKGLIESWLWWGVALNSGAR